MDNQIVQITGISAGILTAVSMLPQLFRIVKKKEAQDISIAMLAILLSGLALWIVYGIFKNDIPIIATNSFSLLLNIILTVLSIRYKKK